MILGWFSRKGTLLIRAIKNPGFRKELLEFSMALMRAKTTKSPYSIMAALDEANDLKEALKKIEDN